jgi:hypothetical protein
MKNDQPPAYYAQAIDSYKLNVQFIELFKSAIRRTDLVLARRSVGRISGK